MEKLRMQKELSVFCKRKASFQMNSHTLRLSIMRAFLVKLMKLFS